MDLLRGIALLLAVAAISFSGELAYSQQEVDPDHFDHPATQSQKAAPVHHIRARSFDRGEEGVGEAPSLARVCVTQLRKSNGGESFRRRRQGVGCFEAAHTLPHYWPGPPASPIRLAGGGGMVMSTSCTCPSFDSGLPNSSVLPTTSTARFSLCTYFLATRPHRRP